MLLLKKKEQRELLLPDKSSWETLLQIDRLGAFRVAALCYIVGKGYALGAQWSVKNESTQIEGVWQEGSARYARFFESIKEQLLEEPEMFFKSLIDEMPQIQPSIDSNPRVIVNMLSLLLNYEDLPLLEALERRVQEDLGSVLGVFRAERCIQAYIKEGFERLQEGRFAESVAWVQKSQQLLKDVSGFISTRTEQYNNSFKNLDINPFLLGCMERGQYHLMQDLLAFQKQLEEIPENWGSYRKVKLSYSDVGRVLSVYEKAPLVECCYTKEQSEWLQRVINKDFSWVYDTGSQQPPNSVCKARMLCFEQLNWGGVIEGKEVFLRGFGHCMKQSDFIGASFFLEKMQELGTDLRLLSWSDLLLDLMKNNNCSIEHLLFVEKKGVLNWNKVLVTTMLYGAKDSKVMEQSEQKVSQILDYIEQKDPIERKQMIQVHTAESTLLDCAQGDYGLQNKVKALALRDQKLRVITLCTLAQILGYSEDLALRLVKMGSDWRFAKKQFKDTGTRIAVFYEHLELSEASLKVLKKKGKLVEPQKGSLRL